MLTPGGVARPPAAPGDRQLSGAAQTIDASVGALVDELVRSGVRHFCACPGSRSTPLLLELAEHPAARLWMHLDERSAAFFGLGLAKARREPVGLVATSGSAAANLLPAMVEAFHARVPLVVLTADRPHELRDCGAPQTIDQLRLFGSHAKWFFDLAEPEATPASLRHVRTLAARAAATARAGPAGPVHLNCPFREPLIPAPLSAPIPSDRHPDRRPSVVVADGPRAPTPELVGALAADLAATPRGLLVCGPQDDPSLAGPLVALAERIGYPVLADPLSGLRRGAHDRSLILDAYDAFLRDAGLAERLAPQVVVRFGAVPTSKPLAQLLQRHPSARLLVVDGDGGWREPAQLASDLLHADPRLLCEALRAALPPAPRHGGWAAEWRAANRRAREAIAAHLAALDELFEGKVFAELAELLPAGATLYVGNSMPVRDLDTFFPAGAAPVRCLANRGANGIDGVVSSALGASAAGPGPLLLVLGDLSFYHDLNGLLAAKLHGLDATIVLLNNDGGGIFSFLPQAELPDHFERLFGTPHGLAFEPIARAYGAGFTRVDSWGGFRSALAAAFRRGGLQLVEVRTDRARNVELHRGVWRAVARALAAEGR